MTDEKLRLGGMALANGVLVHGPKSWACAIRTEDGQLKVAAQRKGQWASKVESPFLRGPARLIHSADERIPVEDLELAVSFMRHAAQAMLA